MKRPLGMESVGVVTRTGEMMAAYASLEDGVLKVGNGLLERKIKAKRGSVLETTLISNKLTEQDIAVTSDEFRLLLMGKEELKAGDFTIEEIKFVQEESSAQAIVILDSERLQITVTYEARKGEHFLRKWLNIKNRSKEKIILAEVLVESLVFLQPLELFKKSSSYYKGMNGVSLDLVAFARGEEGGLFATLDFPYTEVTVEENRLFLGYPPHTEVTPGSVIKTHDSVIGVYRLRKKQIGKLDREEIKSFRECILKMYPPRFNRPVTFMYPINDDDIDFSINGEEKVADIALNQGFIMVTPDQILQEIDLCKELSIEYYLISDGPESWTETNPSQETVWKILDYARKKGVKIGFYSCSNSSIWPPVNFANKPWEHLEWDITSKDGSSYKGLLGHAKCFACEEYLQWYLGKFLGWLRKYPFDMVNFDFLNIAPCYAVNHGHPPGAIYHQIRNLVRFLKAIKKANPGIHVCSDLGWNDLATKICKYMDAFYFTDPGITLPLPALNPVRLSDDSRRELQLHMFNEHFLPCEYFRNTEYYERPDHVVPEANIYQYGILQALAISPNLAFNNVKQFLQRIRADERDTAAQFIIHWIEFAHTNFDCLRKTVQIGEKGPGLGVVDGYAHILKDKGYLFLVNPNYFTLNKSFKLDADIGLTGQRKYYLKEIYPEEKFIRAKRIPWPKYGDNVNIEVPARCVKVIEIGPASEIELPVVTGIEGKVVWQGKGYELDLRAKQGEQRNAVVLLPPEHKATEIPLQQKNIGITSQGNICFLNLKFPGEPVSLELREWIVKKASLEFGLEKSYNELMEGKMLKFPLPSVINRPNPLELLKTPEKVEFEGGNVGKFLGAYIENTMWQKKHLRIQLQCEERQQEKEVELMQAKEEEQECPPQMGPHKYFWLSTTFTIPFVRYGGGEIGYYHPTKHLLIPILIIDNKRVKEIHAWINAREVEIGKYPYISSRLLYYRDQDDFCFYIDSTDFLQKGRNRLVLWIDFE